MSPQEDAAKKNQPLKKSSALQKQPKKTILAGSTNQAPIIVTIEDLDQLNNDFIKGEVVEDDGSKVSAFFLQSRFNSARAVPR
jgi:hypothetical protein